MGRVGVRWGLQGVTAENRAQLSSDAKFASSAFGLNKSQ